MQTRSRSDFGATPCAINQFATVRKLLILNADNHLPCVRAGNNEVVNPAAVFKVPTDSSTYILNQPICVRQRKIPQSGASRCANRKKATPCRQSSEKATSSVTGWM
jgi:hypothetical protein